MQKQTPGPPLHSDRHLMDALDCEAVRAEDLNSFLGRLVSVFCHPAVPASTMRSCTKLSQASHRLKPLGWWTIYQGFKNSICTNRKFTYLCRQSQRRRLRTWQESHPSLHSSRCVKWAH